MQEWIVWACPYERRDLKLTSRDIKNALAWFRDETKEEAKAVMINPKNEHLVNGDIQVGTLGGVLEWEVWLSADKNLMLSEAKTMGEKVAPIAEPSFSEKTKMSILNSKPVSMLKFRPRGRPETYKKRELPEGEIRDLCSTGLGANAISTKLRKEKNIVVSRATIQRVLSGERMSQILEGRKSIDS